MGVQAGPMVDNTLKTTKPFLCSSQRLDLERCALAFAPHCLLDTLDSTSEQEMIVHR